MSLHTVCVGLQLIGTLSIAAFAHAADLPNISATTTSPFPAFKHVQHPIGGSAPRATITRAPSLNHHALQKRASSTASADTCGFINGDADSALYCGGVYSCVFYSTASFGMAGCCSGTAFDVCNWYSTCYASSELSTACTDAACSTDVFALRCTDTASPDCARWTYPALGVQDFACTLDDDDDDSSGTTTATGAGNWTTVLLTAVDSFFSEPTSYTINVTWAPESALTAPRPGDSDNSTSTSGSAASLKSASASASNSASVSAQPSSRSGSGMPTGVIIGGAVGGIVGLVGIIAAVVMFCCLMKRKKRDGAGAVQPVHDSQPVHDAKPAEVDGWTYEHFAELGNVDGHRPVEMDNRYRPAEMENSPRLAEMEGRAKIYEVE